MPGTLSIDSGTQITPILTPGYGAHGQDLPIARQRVDVAAKFIRDLPPGAAQDIALHADIDIASRDLRNYVDALLNDAGYAQDVDKALVALLVEPSFLAGIFEQRAAFRSRCRTTGTAGNGIVVFWTDDLLVSLSGLSTALVREHADAESLPLALRKVAEAAQLRAATQLPELWNELPVSLQSPDASPACKRLATCLLYAAYCLRPILSPDAGEARDSIGLSLRRYLHQLEPLSECQDIEPISLAMLLALYAQTGHNESNAPPLVPLTTSVLHDMLRVLFPDDSTDHAPGKPQTLILRWSRVVPWAWSFFRLDLHEGALLNLTNAWAASWIRLQHGQSVIDLAHSALASIGLGSGLDRSASRVVTVLALQCAIKRVFLFSLLVLLLRDSSVTFTASACRFLCTHLLDGGASEDLMLVALEYLSLSDPARVRKALEPIPSIWKQAASALAAVLSDASSCAHLRLQTLLDLGTIISRADPDASKSARPMFGTPVQRWLVEHPSVSILQSSLQLWALLAPSAVKLPTVLWDVIYNEGPANLYLASAFAHYVTSKGAISADDAEEAFDYLRDAFLYAAVVQPAQANADYDLTGDEQIGLGLLVAPILCLALGALAAGMTPEAARFSLESPLTKTFVAELRRLSDDAAPSPNPVNCILARRIGASGIAAATLSEMRCVAREIGIDEGAFAFRGSNDSDLSVVLPERSIVFLPPRAAAPEWVVLLRI